MAVTVYGIPNCDSVKKARASLDAQGVSYTFHDYKKLGVPEAELKRWVAAKGWDVVLNRKGTTWRGLDDAVKASVVDDASAMAVMLANASTIKRPVVTRGDVVIVGADFAELGTLVTASG
jgi:Spx/MgsR family transcriptional regulator